MKTLRIQVNPDRVDSASSREGIASAAAILAQGGLVAFPTETVYGLGANALDTRAVEGIFLAKQRPAWDPLIVHVADAEMLEAVVATASVHELSRQLMDAFWPGPLTLLLPEKEQVPRMVTAGRPLVGVRLPAHPVTRALIAAAGVPIAAPSANRFGHLSPTLAAHVLSDLDGRIDAVLDAGETAHGIESTVVDASQSPVILYRPGAVTLESLRAVCGEVVEWKSPSHLTPPESLPSPGVGIRHYAPRARLIVVDEESAGSSVTLLNSVSEARRDYLKVGALLPEDHPAAAGIRSLPSILLFDWGRWNDPEQLAHRLFAGLHSLDQAGAEVILCPLPPASGIGSAIRDRLLKAAKFG